MCKNILGFKAATHIKQLLGSYQESFKILFRSGNGIKTYCWFGGQKLINDQCSMALHSVERRKDTSLKFVKDCSSQMFVPHSPGGLQVICCTLVLGSKAFDNFFLCHFE